MQKKRIVLTGGHAATTALATIQEILQNRALRDLEMHWIGAHRAIEGTMVPTIEENVFPKFGVIMHSVVAGRLQRRFTRYTISSLAKIPVGFWQSYLLLRKIKPVLIVSFGGNVGLTVSAMAWILRIPIILHEQTVAAGLANRLSARFARRIALARPQSLKFFPEEKCVIIGNPIIEEILALPPKTKPNKKPVIFITCGSRGSQLINKAIEASLPDLVQNYKLIHQTGELDYPHFKLLEQEGYEVYSTISPVEIAKMYEKSDLIVARAGANTVSEVLTLSRPSIFIPIPWVQYNEQAKNASIAKQAGLSVVIDQKHLSAKRLLSEIKKILNNWQQIVKRAHLPDNIPDDRLASAKLVALIERNIEQ